MEAIIQHLWQVCGIDRGKMNRGHSRMCASVRVRDGGKRRRQRERAWISAFSFQSWTCFGKILKLNSEHLHPKLLSLTTTSGV